MTNKILKPATKTMVCHIKPANFRVLIDPEVVPDEETYGDAGLLVVNSGTQRQRQGAHQRGTLSAIGPTCHKDHIIGLKLGESVLFTKFGGRLTEDPYTGHEYVLLNDEDITAIIQEEGELVYANVPFDTIVEEEK